MNSVQCVSRGRQLETRGVGLGTVNVSVPYSMVAQEMSSFVTGWVWALLDPSWLPDLQARHDSRRSQQGAAESHADPRTRAWPRGVPHPPASSLCPFLYPSGLPESPHSCPGPETWVPPSLGLTGAGTGPCPLVA